MKRYLISLTMAAGLVLTGCASTAPVVPGAVNAFDSNTYTTLLTVQAAINAAVAINNTSPLNATAKKVLNDAIAAYDIAEAAYVAYHAALTATPSTATLAMQTQLSTQLATATTAATTLSTAVKPK